MSLHASVVDVLTRWQTTDPAQDSLRHAVLAFVLGRADACQRDCAPGHVTASTLVLDHTGTRALLTLHPRIGRWVQLGGHCEESDPDIAAAATREAREESGIDGLTVGELPVALHVHALSCSLGVPTRHLDLQFVARAAPDAHAAISHESLDLRWWPLDALPAGSDFGLRQLARAAAADTSPRTAQTSVE